MSQREDDLPSSPETAAELRARAARYRALAKQYSGDVVDRVLGLAAELEERAAAMESVKPDGADQRLVGKPGTP